MTYGTIIRADDCDSELVPHGSGVGVRANGKARGGNNNDDGELKYGRGDNVSTVLKAVLDADLKYRNLGMFEGAISTRSLAATDSLDTCCHANVSGESGGGQLPIKSGQEACKR